MKRNGQPLRFVLYGLRPTADRLTNEFGIGTGLHHPRVTQGSPKRHAREMRGLVYVSALFATEMEKGRVGV